MDSKLRRRMALRVLKSKVSAAETNRAEPCWLCTAPLTDRGFGGGPFVSPEVGLVCSECHNLILALQAEIARQSTSEAADIERRRAGEFLRLTRGMVRAALATGRNPSEFWTLLSDVAAITDKTARDAAARNLLRDSFEDFESLIDAAAAARAAIGGKE